MSLSRWQLTPNRHEIRSRSSSNNNKEDSVFAHSFAVSKENKADEFRVPPLLASIARQLSGALSVRTTPHLCRAHYLEDEHKQRNVLCQRMRGDMASSTSKKQARDVGFWSLMAARWIFFCLLLTARPGFATKIPEASSTLLRMHRLYLQQPPHDRTLYDALHVSSNATAAEVTKAYRRLSLRYHPDKVADDSQTQRIALLEKVREAYEILKDDSTRLPYHRYGLLTPTQAVHVLTGQGRDSPGSEELLRLMGYHVDGGEPSHKERLLLLASDLVEQLRPVVEGRISEHAFLESVAADIDCLKKLPLGAQIVRCVGRAYRHAGQRYLRSEKAAVPERLRHGWRQGKLLLTAAAWWGRAVLTDNIAMQSTRVSSSTADAITYHGWRDSFGELSPRDNAPSDDEIRERERHKAKKAMVESTQVEALWKISKIGLDRTIREACDVVLSGEVFFFPKPSSRGGKSDGWIGSKGNAIDTSLGRLRAATALALMGDVMVQRSKEGTSWME